MKRPLFWAKPLQITFFCYPLHAQCILVAQEIEGISSTLSDGQLYYRNFHDMLPPDGNFQLNLRTKVCLLMEGCLKSVSPSQLPERPLQFAKHYILLREQLRVEF